MAGHLLFLILIYSFHQIEVQALLPPKLTVSRSVIREMDSVTLSCEAPPSVSVSQCYFYTMSGGTVREYPCLNTLDGTVLLEMANRTSPAEVKVNCYYTIQPGGSEQSSYSDISSITIQPLLPPELIVNPPVITEKDSVTLNCQTPSSVSVSHCHFYTMSGRTNRDFPCLKTLTGTELLKMANSRSPAEVKVSCSYIVKHPSLYSDLSSITVQSTNEEEERNTDSPASTPDTWLRKLLIVSAGCGVTVGVILLGFVLVRPQRQTDDLMNTRHPGEELPSGNEQAPPAITSLPAADFLTVAGFVERDRQEPQNTSDTYHMYTTISDEPAASVQRGMMYSTVKAH